MIKEITREEFIKKFGICPNRHTKYLENGIMLFNNYWNGEVYIDGFQYINEDEIPEPTGKDYRPVYSDLDEYGDCDILGYEEE